MFKNEEYSSFLNILTKKIKFTILLIYKFYFHAIACSQALTKNAFALVKSFSRSHLPDEYNFLDTIFNATFYKRLIRQHVRRHVANKGMYVVCFYITVYRMKYYTFTTIGIITTKSQ